MTAAELYSSSTITEAFGKSRTFEVVRHLRTTWPDFPKYDQKVNNYHLAWVVFILAKCRTTRLQDVQKAIIEGTELECDGQPFIPWFGDLLFDYQRIENDIRSIYIFYVGDNLVDVMQQTSRILFQGEKKANVVQRVSILKREFLLELSELLMPYEDESLDGPEFEFDEEKHPDPRPTE